MRSAIFYSSIGSWWPLPRRENVTLANAIATPIAAPYTATDASAIELLISVLQITSMFFTKKNSWSTVFWQLLPKWLVVKWFREIKGNRQGEHTNQY